MLDWVRILVASETTAASGPDAPAANRASLTFESLLGGGQSGEWLSSDCGSIRASVPGIARICRKKWPQRSLRSTEITETQFADQVGLALDAFTLNGLIMNLISTFDRGSRPRRSII